MPSDVSKSFMEKALPTLQSLSTSEVGVNLIKAMSEIHTKIIIDETDVDLQASAPASANSVVNKSDKITKEGLYDIVTISPIMSTISVTFTLSPKRRKASKRLDY